MGIFLYYEARGVKSNLFKLGKMELPMFIDCNSQGIEFMKFVLMMSWSAQSAQMTDFSGNPGYFVESWMGY